MSLLALKSSLMMKTIWMILTNLVIIIFVFPAKIVLIEKQILFVSCLFIDFAAYPWAYC